MTCHTRKIVKFLIMQERLLCISHVHVTHNLPTLAISELLYICGVTIKTYCSNNFKPECFRFSFVEFQHRKSVNAPPMFSNYYTVPFLRIILYNCCRIVLQFLPIYVVYIHNSINQNLVSSCEKPLSNRELAIAES